MPRNSESGRIRSLLRWRCSTKVPPCPFIARYRKEVTGNLDDTQLRNLEERLLYLRELEERRAVILASIEEQGKLTDELRGAIEAAATKQALEDIYLPYKPKRRTRAQIAREAGLEPLADALFADPTLDPQQEAAKYVNDTATESSNAINVPDAQAALDGARDILSSVLPRPPSCWPNCVRACGNRASLRPR